MGFCIQILRFVSLFIIIKVIDGFLLKRESQGMIKPTKLSPKCLDFKFKSTIIECQSMALSTL